LFFRGSVPFSAGRSYEIALPPPEQTYRRHPMKRLGLATLLFPATLWLAAADRPAPKPQGIPLDGHTFTLPDGFEIELVAGPPLVNRPIVADFDEQGRLYVADSSGTNDKLTEQLEKKPHRILRLEDTKGDGKFDKATVFADKVMFPEGA